MSNDIYFCLLQKNQTAHSEKTLNSYLLLSGVKSECLLFLIDI